jgi:TonB-linked SusC/RagA family outer membrane protein
MQLILRRLIPILLVFGSLNTGLIAQFTASGTVTDITGEPLIGVSILIDGTSTGTISDVDGSFSVNMPEGYTELVFSYTGYKSKNVTVRPDMGPLTVVLDEDIARLEEVVVTGLASGVRRSNSGNAVATITSDELTGQTQIQTVDGALNGKLAGVNISSNSGAPGGGINVQLRGISTLGAGSSQPLYIVDGVYVNNSSIRTGRSQVSGATGGQSSATQDNAANRIADLNPDDIERIEVLKGPSAAAIYGTRANAGVIIITTKRGQAGDTRISFSQDIGIARGQNFQGLSEFDEENLTARGVGQEEFDKLRAAEAAGTVVDWEEEMYGETPLLSNSQLSISGGGQNTQFYVSGGLTTEDGIIKNTGFDRYSIRTNVDQRIGQRIRLALNTNYLRTDSDRGFTGNQNNTGGSLGYSIAYTPTYASLQPDENGNYPTNPYFNDNPYAIRDLSVNNQVVDRFITSAVLDIDVFTNRTSFLKLKVNGGVDYLSGNSQVYFPEVLQHQQATANPGDVMWGRQDNLNTNIQAFLNYNKEFTTLNSNTTVGVVRLSQNSEFLLQRGRGLSGGQNNLAWAQVVNTQEQTFQEVTDLGFVIQEDLNWENKLIASLGVRFDKSTLNAQQNEFYAFPKASLAANIHNFDFFNSSAISQLKLRGAYGETGGLPNFGVTFESLSSTLIGGQLGGVVGTRGVDPDLVPETASEIELGLDLGLLENRIVLEATYYNKQVNDLILDRQPAESTGILAIATNAADLENRGFELGLTLNPVRTDQFDWTSRILYWQNRSEITRLAVPAFTQGGFGPSLGTYLLAEGFSPTTIVGTPSDVDARPGSLGFSVYGDRQPDFTMTWFNTFQIMRNLEAGFLLHYQNGGSAINLSALLWDDGGSTPNWAGDDDGDGTPNGLDRLLSWAVDGNTGVFVQPTGYLKLREASLYYTLPDGILGDAVKRLRLGVSANNLLLWTEYGSYDPEVSNFGTQPVSGSIEVAPYPSARRLFFHLKADF